MVWAWQKMAELPKSKEWKSLDKIELLKDEELGVGAYGRVFKAKLRGSVYAAKEIHAGLIDAAYALNEKRNLRDSFLRECHHCSKLNHPNIVTFVGVYHPPKQLIPVMIMEMMDQSLTNYAKKQNISFKTKISILRDVAEGLGYLHSYPVIHRDLSPNNILLKFQPLFPVAKIADLGVAKILKDDINSKKYLSQMPGTIDFMPPEAHAEKAIYDVSLDVFSYGGIMLYTVNGVWPTPTPLIGYDETRCMAMAKEFNEVERRQEHLNKLTGEAEVFRLLVELCLDNDPAKRPTMIELSKKLKVCLSLISYMLNINHMYMS